MCVTWLIKQLHLLLQRDPFIRDVVFHLLLRVCVCHGAVCMHACMHACACVCTCDLSMLLLLVCMCVCVYVCVRV